MIITIGRQFGSGGRELGRRLAEALHIAYYDQEIISGIAERTSLSEQYVHEVLEQRPIPLFPITIGRSFYPHENPADTQARTVYAEQSKLIHELAEKSSCVIVGRCADYILRDEDIFRIFVYADMPSKMQRCREKGEDPQTQGLNDKELKNFIQRVDKNRAAYYEFYTGQDWGDILNYDLCVNTTNTEIKRIIPYLTGMLTERLARSGK